MVLIDEFLRINLDILVSLLYIRNYLVDFLRLVLFLLSNKLLFGDEIIFIPSESFDFGSSLLLHEGDLLFLDVAVALLGLFHGLEFGEVAHEAVVLLLVELELLLLGLAGALALLQLDRVLVHGVPVEELLVAGDADLAPTLPRRVVHRVRPRLVQARPAVQSPAELTTMGYYYLIAYQCLSFWLGLMQLLHSVECTSH